MSSLSLTIYKCTSPVNALDKALEGAISFNGILKHACTITAPILTIARPNNDYLVGYNYAYIAEFNRYYYMTVTLEAGGTATLTLTLDPFMSFRTGIRAQTLYIERQEHIFDPYFHDDAVAIAQGSIIDTVDVGAVGTTRNIYITCVGASQEEPESE